MKVPLYQVDAFTDKLFGGNPAAVCPLKEWLPDIVMQKIAAENNLSETAFFVTNQDGFHLRWFTPAVEVPLCGHATLASAHVLFNHLHYPENEIRFHSLSGLLKVKKEGEWLTLDFPADPPVKVETPSLMEAILKTKPIEVWKGKMRYMVLLSSQSEVESLSPDFSLMIHLDGRGVIVTANGKDADFVSRFFAPRIGINEDPVTGGAHTVLIPYWAKILGKNELIARQVSKRGGYLKCKLNGDRVEMSGNAVSYLVGEIFI
jgi:PhzF family phenazine biosynthesis protein